ncbi:MAG: class I SAM-dependent methyltransferase [Planctomycetales bacterium]|nr:class I SAM-dependent methyltransferase [Planctomycetales bacterium]
MTESRGERTCPACSNREWQSIQGTRGGDYLRCRICRYHVLLTDSSDDRTKAFEAEQERFYGDDNSIFFTQISYELQDARVRNRIRVLQRHLRQGKLIEVGPGSGEVLGQFKTLGYEVTGVEHSAKMAKVIRERYGIDVVVGAFEEHDFPVDYFDAYLSFHVIEHVTDVAVHLQKATDVLRPGGLAFIATPNADSWEHRFAGSLSPNFSPAHLQLFSKDSIDKMLQQAGFRIVETLTPCYTDAWLRVASSFYRNLRGRKVGYADLATRSDTPWRRRLIHAYSVADWPFRAVQSMLRGGNELFVVAKKT